MSSFSRRPLLLAVLMCGLGFVLPCSIVLGADAEENEFFERKVRPLLVQHCFSCHARGQKKGGLSLANREGLLAGGENGAVVSLEKPAESSLIAAVEQRGSKPICPRSSGSASG